jgi:hypothetical protein
MSLNHINSEALGPNTSRFAALMEAVMNIGPGKNSLKALAFQDATAHVKQGTVEGGALPHLSRPNSAADGNSSSGATGPQPQNEDPAATAEDVRAKTSHALRQTLTKYVGGTPPCLSDPNDAADGDSHSGATELQLHDKDSATSARHMLKVQRMSNVIFVLHERTLKSHIGTIVQMIPMVREKGAVDPAFFALFIQVIVQMVDEGALLESTTVELALPNGTCPFPVWRNVSALIAKSRKYRIDLLTDLLMVRASNTTPSL